MQNEKCSNKTLRVCGAGGVRKNKGKWQAVVTVADEMTGKKVVSVNLFFTSFAKQAHRSRKGGFTGCANAFSPIPVTA